jgi:Interleukin-like EMT inducer
MSQVWRRRISVHALVVALYFLLALVLTWPLVRHLTTHVPGSYTWAFDEYTFLWNSWWFRYSAFDLGQNPLFSSHTFYPLGISLVLYTYNLFNALLSLPLQPYLSLPTISNLTFLFATVLSGYGTFILVEYLLRPNSKSRLVTSAAFLAGPIYTFGSYRMVYAAIGHYDMWSTAWIPFYALYLIRTFREPRWRNAVLAAVFLVLAMLSEMIFGVFLAMLSLIILAFVIGRRERAHVAGGPSALLRRLLVLGLVATLLYLPLLVPILREMLGGYELAGWGDAEKLSVDLLGFVTPTALHPLGGGWVETLQQTREGTSRFSDVNTVFLGWTGLVLAVAGAVLYRRRLAAWIASFIVFALFSLGPLLQINGRSTFDLDGLAVNVPLPFILLHYLPIVKANRVPNRFSVVLMLSLAVLAGFGAYWLLKRVSNAKVRASRFFLVPSFAILAILLVFEHWSVPLPLTDARIPPVYEQVPAGDFSLLQLPLGWRNSFGVQGAESTQTQYYQSYHHKRLLSGNISRNRPFEFDYFRGVPILDSLTTIETYGQVDAERRASDRATAPEFVSFYDIRYVVVAPGIEGRPPYVDTRDEAVAYLEEVLPVEKVYDQDGWLLYRVDQPALPAAYPVDFGSAEPRMRMVLGEGWAEDEEIQGATANWAVAEQSRVFLPAAAGSDYRLTVEALPFDYPGAGEQGMALRVNGNELNRVTLAPGWAEYAWDVPADFLRPGLNDVWFEFDHVAAPADVLPGNGTIGTTGIQAPLAIEVHSGGPADFAYITVGTGEEAQDGSVHGPGYNVAVIDPRTGRILDRQGFDTTPSGSEAEAAALADYLNALPEGRIVAVAMQGEGTAHLTEEAVAALHGLGGQADPRGTTGWSHALIGVKGAQAGTALEAAGPEDGWLRVAPDQRTLAVAVDSLLWERKE